MRLALPAKMLFLVTMSTEFIGNGLQGSAYSRASATTVRLAIKATPKRDCGGPGRP